MNDFYLSIAFVLDETRRRQERKNVFEQSRETTAVDWSWAKWCEFENQTRTGFKNKRLKVWCRWHNKHCSFHTGICIRMNSCLLYRNEVFRAKHPPVLKGKTSRTNVLQLSLFDIYSGWSFSAREKDAPGRAEFTSDFLSTSSHLSNESCIR